MTGTYPIARAGSGGAVMDFYAVLDQVVALLRSRGRVSYRALKRQFDLDDAYLDDLKAEIIEVHQLAVDQDGTMLVWTGDGGARPEPLPQRMSLKPSSRFQLPKRRCLSSRLVEPEQRICQTMHIDHLTLKLLQSAHHFVCVVMSRDHFSANGLQRRIGLPTSGTHPRETVPLPPPSQD